jgi:hypothetical protein
LPTPERRLAAILAAVLAFAQFRAGRVEEAVRIWEANRASNPDMIPALFSLASWYEGAGATRKRGPWWRRSGA